MTLTDLLELIGGALVVVGVALIWAPAAVILAGLLIIGISVRIAMQKRDRPLLERIDGDA